LTQPLETLPWTEAVRGGDSPERRRFLEAHVDLVRYAALRIAARLPAFVELDDLIHDGIVGLLDATERFDPSRAVRFRTYAEARVRGAILDGLRRGDWRPRSLRRGRREVDDAAGNLRAALGRPATEEEIAAELGLALDADRELLRETSAGPLLSLDAPCEGGTTVSEPAAAVDLHATLEHDQLLELLTREIARLPDRERRILELYYHEGLNMKEIGAVLGVTESRVCQLHSQAAARLRSALGAGLRAPRAGALAGDRRAGSVR
jgi:RNA polymerase sigma factor for flagellar operon FliA